MRGGFVDREEEFDQLAALATGLARGHGGAVVLEGESGIGKSALIEEFLQRLKADDTPVRTVRVRCSPGIGPMSPYGPIIEILADLTGSGRLGGKVRRLALTSARTAPDVLGVLVPPLEKPAKVAVEVTRAAVRTASVPLDSIAPLQHTYALTIAKTLMRHATRHRPLILVLDDVQFLDEDSLRVLDVLMDKLPDKPLGLILSHAAENGSAPGVPGMIGHWADRAGLTRRAVDPLPAWAVADLVRGWHPEAPDELAARLYALTGGRPLFLVQCLRSWTPGDGADPVLPASLTEHVRQRLAGLDPATRRVLDVAAAQGQRFLSRVAADVTGLEHDEVSDRLRALTEARVVERETHPPEWTRDLRTDSYLFGNEALWRAIADCQTPEQLRSRRERIAEALVALEPADPHVDLQLEIARQLHDAGAPCRAASARRHLELAGSMATESLSVEIAEQFCRTAIADATAAPGEMADRDEVVADAVILLLSLSEVRWRGRQADGRDSDLEKLAGLAVRAAERVAERTGSDRRRVLATMLLGKILMTTTGLHEGLPRLAEAVRLARAAGDPVPLFVARVEYGRQLGKQDLAAGVEQLTAAEQMYASRAEIDTDDPLVRHTRNLAEMQLGVNMYDLGRPEEALRRLRSCADRLRGEAMNVELPIALNYLAQVLIAVGRAEQADEVLREAVEYEREHGPSGWRGYNLALRAVLASQSADPARRADGIGLMAQAWADTAQTWLLNLVPIVRNFHAEVLLNAAADGDDALWRHAFQAKVSGPDTPGDPFPDTLAPTPDGRRAWVLAEAEALASVTVDETEDSGMTRSWIAAHLLLARISLLRDRTHEAAQRARTAVARLEEVGDMPALRTEEVYHCAARAVRADGDAAEADELHARALAAVRRKAAAIGDPDLRDDFLHRVPLNVAIFDDDQQP